LSEMMNTREVADYLRIKERKVYDLVRLRRIPCSRVAGKWLFPKALVDLWVLQNTRSDPAFEPPGRPALLFVGSHDPLLEWAIHESGCEIPVLSDGSLDGLRRFAQGEAAFCGLHVFDPETETYNEIAVKDVLRDLDTVLIEWAWRDQGLIVASGNPHGISKLSDLKARKLPFIGRQESAGSHLLLMHLLAQENLSPADLTTPFPPARNETDMAAAVNEGKAAAGFGVRAAAEQFRLGFISLHRERYDLAVRRREYFEPNFQKLLSFARNARFSEKARSLGGYDAAGLGRVIYNGP
jgi:putative molybdopterin biosynthesis protein